jgi:putative glutamine amidotransferase
VDPVLYGETQVHQAVYGINALRDEAEIRVSRWAAENDVPLFGICRGHQVVNVALGGTLVADIPTQVQTNLPHDFPDGTPLDVYAHPVAITPGSRLAGIVGVTDLTVNSWHHQSVREAGKSLIVSARAPDGVVEATEAPGARFLLTVQWHPEKLSVKDPAAAALFAAFVEAATKRPTA